MDDDRKRWTLFGKDLGDIPCFRDSWIYGISGGVGAGLVHFLFTSKPGKSCHVGFGSSMAFTLIYWFGCRYHQSKQIVQLRTMQEYVEKKVLIEGTEMEKLYEADIANMSNKADV